MLLRIGVISMSFAVVLALALVAALTFRDKPEEVVATEPAASSPEPTTEQVYQDPRDKMLDLPDPEPEPAQPEPSPESESESASGQNPAPAPESASGPQPGSGPEQDALPLAGSDWPMPDSAEIEAANGPRRYDWAPGAVLALTVESIGLYNAPVMGNDGRQALDSGVVHVPETSMPWTRSPHRNVYLAGHRLGWPGTGSRLIFYNLNQLKNGDEVVLRDRRDRKYRYRVSEMFVVGPGERWVMGQIRNRDMVTLQTCTGPNFSQRLIVRADRV
jgi:sortase A